MNLPLMIAEPLLSPDGQQAKTFPLGNFSFPFSRPQNGNSDLISSCAVSNWRAGSEVPDRSPAKHLLGLDRASVESCPSNPEPHGAFQRCDPTPRRGPETHAVNPLTIHSN